MRQEWDNIDKIIAESYVDVDLTPDYNQRLMNKLEERHGGKEQSFIGGFSFVMAGLLMLFLYTSDIQYRLINMETRAKSEIIRLQYNFDSSDIMRLFIGE